MAVNISIDTSALNQLSNLFGLNNWELQTAKFNGVSFFIVPNSWEKFNPFQPQFELYNQLFNNKDNNSALSSDTSLSLQNIKDIQTRKLSTYLLPNYDGFIINDQGANGIVYDCVGLFVGDDYLTAINNFRAALMTQSSSGYDFVHPIYGTLTNCYCQQFSLSYNYSEWKAATYNIKIVQAGTSIVKNNTISTSQIINKALNAINTSINAINFAAGNISTATSAISSLGRFTLANNALFNSENPTNSTLNDPESLILAISVSLNNVAQILNSATALVYQQLLYNNVTNYYFANTIIDYNNLPRIYRYATIKTLQFDNILQFYSTNIDNCIVLYKTYNLDTIFNEDIFLLKQSLSQLDGLLKSTLNQIEQTYTTYTVPFDMSFRLLFSLNNLDFNNVTLVKTFIDINSNKLNDLNVIIKGSVMTLPKGVQ